jgi:hypothetical protein
MNNVVPLPNEKLKNYLRDSLKGFANDPPDTSYQQGYLAAIEEIYRVFFGPGSATP